MRLTKTAAPFFASSAWVDTERISLPFEKVTMSSLVSPGYAATQYALLSSLYALPGKFIGGLSGFMVEAMGYPRFFAATALIGIPVALLCLAVWRWSAAPARSREAELRLR